ncbi:MAG TPA: CoA transferase [Caulobacteraceae bacterium]|jgi:crotonobetainyl-CoA:carnitine CoA-transferase CaiB-like acyl-CoA transferase|nr:CoA transferase [Caulobacteraceae bacterium]
MTAFQDIRVLDCTQGLAGPLASMLLGDFGAQVLKVEPPEGDRARKDPGYLTWNRNKKRLTLDLARSEERERLAPLLAAADIAVFDHSPRDLEALRLDAGSLIARHPRLIHLWTPPYGTTGRWSELPAHHEMLMGLSGASFRQGAYSDQPVWHVAQIVHHAQGIMAASAAGAALIQRGADGGGRAVTVSGLHAMAETACPVSHAGLPAGYRGHPLGGSPSYRLYQCGDGQWLFLAALLSHFFHRAVMALGLMGAMNGDIGAAIQALLRTQPRDHWLAVFREADVPAGGVEHREDFLASELIRANDLVAELEQPELGPVRMVGVPARLSDTPGAVRHLIEDATAADLAAFAQPRPEPAELTRRSGAPLEGVRVLDLGTLIAGTYAATILANFGADVVKVESQDGDPFRFAMAFINYNRGKRGLGLDLKSDAGRALFHDLALGADVVLDNFRLGVRERLGVDYAALARLNPRLVSCSINTYGTRGPDARLPGFDPLLQARSGQMWAQGGDEGEPVFHAIAVNDVATAAMGAFTIIAALHARLRTGRGQDTETSLAAQSALYQSGDLTWYAGRPPMAKGGRDCVGFGALDRFYRCADGWLTLGCSTAKQFADLASALERPGLTRRWDGAAALAEPRDGALAAELAAAFAGLRRDNAADILCDAGVPAAPVLHADEAHRSDFFWENRYWELRSHPGEGELVASRGFADFDGTSLRFERLHPGLGEHGVEVLMDYGVPRERIVGLARERVIFRG